MDTTSTDIYSTENGASNGCIAEEAENQTLLSGQGYSEFYTSKIAEMVKLNGLQNSPTQSLFTVVNKVLDDSIERKDGSVLHCMAFMLKKVIQEIEYRVSNQADKFRKQNNLYMVLEDKYQSRIRILEALATGTTEEAEVIKNQLHQTQNEKTEIEERVKLEEQFKLRLEKEKDQRDSKISTLKQELDVTIKTYEDRCTQLVNQSQETKLELEKKIGELEKTLNESKKMVKELETFSQSKSMRWKRKELSYKKILDYQCGSLEDLKLSSEQLKQEVLKTKRIYLEEFNHLGMNLKGLTEAAESYHVVLAENRKLYNEVQDLKGNIRVYCRVRPFLAGQSKKLTTIEYIGENGELVVTNPLKQVKDGHRLFKFNKVFGPATTQEEVFLDTQPLIRSVLDGYNVCIFAYGQTGSGKTYTMSGPNISSKEDWGVNYRALSDLFGLSQTRRNSITYEVSVQMVEIYNEQVRDLLSNEASQKRLGIWSTSQPNGYAVPDATIHLVKSSEDVMELMYIGQMNRAVGATALNERSSRSHSILTVHVRGVDLESDAILRGSLHLVDLAGSERVDRSEATGDRLKEAQHINKSLSALGDVIFALAQKNSHVPYRNSKLTQVLQSSLGGQAKTLMFVQLNPDADSHSETVSTLKFAERVSGVELGAAKSHKEGRGLRELMDQAASLKETIAKKDDEIARLRMLKGNNNVNGERCGLGSPTQRFGGSASPGRPSSGGSRQRRSQSERKLPGLVRKAASDCNSSDFSDKHSESGSPPSVEDFRPSVDGSQSLSEYAENRFGQNTLEEDVVLLGIGDADGEDRLSDISDSGLSMGTETDASINSVVEFTLFPESSSSKQSNVPAELPRPPQKQTLKAAARSSITRSSSKLPSSRKAAAGTGGSSSSSKRWQ
ncbi:kinesin-like protein KIN-14J [Impatiens glandulifera]|uniref:kinesin-like protein KIN-14J n=1 Tax=Impatiens glandulifera TaxID=253017 RepID=UPI001FB0EE65|nr:kinesin-like protein KIN-14J [Impatiens glandulifera]XP_047325616.1 kinesin-like protein KIN-14J [Impatiens glandulifera]